MPYKELSTDYSGDRSEVIRERVARAREIQVERFKGERVFCNGQMKARHIKKYCKLTDEAEGLLDVAMERLGLSARAYTRVLKVSRTIADLEGSDKIQNYHVSEAIQYRTLDRVMF